MKSLILPDRLFSHMGLASGIIFPMIFATVLVCNPCGRSLSGFQETGSKPKAVQETKKQELSAKQKALVEELRKRHAKVTYRSQTGKISITFPGGFEIRTLRDNGDVDSRKDLNWKNDDKILERLRELPIESVTIQNPRFSAKEFRAICRLTKLEQLAISAISKLEPEAYIDIGNLKNLTSLNVSAGTVDDELLIQFSQLKKLKSLSLAHANVSSKSMERIARMKTLEYLDYSFVAYDADVIKQICSMQQLKQLRLGAFHDRGRPNVIPNHERDIPGLENLSNLVSLRLHMLKPTDRTFEGIGKLRGLRFFGLWGVNINDEQFITCLPALRGQKGKDNKMIIHGISGTSLKDKSIHAMLDDEEFRLNEFALPMEFPVSMSREAVIRFKRAWPKTVVRHKRILRDLGGGYKIATDTVELPESGKVPNSPRKDR